MRKLAWMVLVPQKLKRSGTQISEDTGALRERLGAGSGRQKQSGNWDQLLPESAEVKSCNWVTLTGTASKLEGKWSL